MPTTVPAFTVALTGAALGARVTGINLEEPIAPEAGAGIRAAFLEHNVRDGFDAGQRRIMHRTQMLGPLTSQEGEVTPSWG